MAEESAVSAASLARAARTQAALRAAMVAAQSYNQVRLFTSPNERFPAPCTVGIAMVSYTGCMQSVFNFENCAWSSGGSDPNEPDFELMPSMPG